MVHRDTEGYLFFHYRQGEAIRRNGEFINPDAIARVLAEHPAVTDVCVYGVPARSGAPGEHDIVAAVVPTDRTQFDPTSIFAACRQALPANAMPSYLHVVSALPKTLSEKPQKRLLLERFDPKLVLTSLSPLRGRVAPHLPAWRHRLECLYICLFIGLIKHQANLLHASIEKRLHLIATLLGIANNGHRIHHLIRHELRRSVTLTRLVACRTRSASAPKPIR